MFMQRNVAYLLLIVMLGLIALGLVMLTSTSAMLASQDLSGVYSKLKRAVLSGSGFGGIGVRHLRAGTITGKGAEARPVDASALRVPARSCFA